MDAIKQMVKVAGFISDVHAEDIIFETSIMFFKRQGIKDIYCLGDFCDGYGNVDRIISRARNEGIISVKGNHDIWCLGGIMRNMPDSMTLADLSNDSIDFLKSLPKTREITTSTGSVLLCHGILDNEMARVCSDDYGYAIESNDDLQMFINGSYPSIMINGHTHRKMVKQIQDKTIINVGTLFREHNPSLTIVDFENKNVYFYDIIGGIVKDEPEVIELK
ncbi:metallophosphoesterase family protein [Pseudobacteroides cellulosolvens]|uniref:Calcineurin-like phosphoesterase superfamily domain containing protein n=2 Tax=Pseudobacteroides cellulosolvens TaxID=35825 RepID=A0A0L6JJ71_9FIRM|nr:metallophosphoesterase family protein [Pseudobacteroides cellulosolvens]KNY25487.1 Calcineurin-like phosphoesterase superfamily domain containing protein [Pseudobacteroides cellulosolvens ATCC 35603 = DSM 2933]